MALPDISQQANYQDGNSVFDNVFILKDLDTLGLILTSPNGTKYRLVVADDGTLSTTAVNN